MPLDRRSKNLLDMIESTVAPETWRDNGGKIGSIRELNGQLIVNQLPANHVEVMKLLQQLRETRLIQVALESRLLVLDDDVYAGLVAEKLLMEPKDPLKPETLTIDNSQLSRLLTETQAAKRTVVISPPRTTVANGQSGSLQFQTRVSTMGSSSTISTPSPPPAPRRLTTSHKPKDSANPASDLVAVISPLINYTCPVCTAQPTVSADRKNIVTQIEVTLRHLERIEQTPYPNAPPGKTFPIDKPIVSTKQFKSVVSLADGRTALINAGIVDIGDLLDIQPDEVGKKPVPRHLVILFRPNLIIHREIETDVFGKESRQSTGLPDECRFRPRPCSCVAPAGRFRAGSYFGRGREFHSN